MNDSIYAIGQAVFLRTDTPEYVEEIIPFKTLEELVKICSTAHENLSLDKILIYSLVDGQPQAVTLGFMCSSKQCAPGEFTLPQLAD